MFQCPNCGGVVGHTRFGRCPYCGFDFSMNAKNQFKMYKDAIRERRMFRAIFVLLELGSFFIALGFCFMIARILQTDIFRRESWLILAVWAYIAYKIYDKLRFKIR